VAYGVAVVPSTAIIRSNKLRALPLVLRGTSIGEWSTVCWDPQRQMPPYVEQFVHELLAHARRSLPGREFLRRAPPLARPKEPID